MAQLLESIYTVVDSEEITPPSDFISGLSTNDLYAWRCHSNVIAKKVEYTDSFISPKGLRPDIKFTANNTTYIVDIIVKFDDSYNLVTLPLRENYHNMLFWDSLFL